MFLFFKNLLIKKEDSEESIPPLITNPVLLLLDPLTIFLDTLLMTDSKNSRYSSNVSLDKLLNKFISNKFSNE